MRDKEDLYADALTHWGPQFQIQMMIEETSELITVLAKVNRAANYSDIEQVTEEMADVEIMLEQMKILFDNEDMVKATKEKKLERLDEMLRTEKEKLKALRKKDVKHIGEKWI